LIAGLSALALCRSGFSPTTDGLKPVPHAPPKRLLLAAALSGFALLALEVIWFRFVIFFVASTMLAVVLAGIGIGALIASAIWTRFPMLSYSGFVAEPARYETTSVVIDSLRLMLPVSILSGVSSP